MTRIALLAALGALLLFAAFAARLRPRLGPGAGLLQAALLALFLGLAGAFLALRIAADPAAATRAPIVLAEAGAARRDPSAIREELARLPAGARARLALYESGAGDPEARALPVPEGLEPLARFSSLAAALAWAALEARSAALPDVLVLGGPPGPADPPVPAGITVTRIPLAEPSRRDRIGPLRLARQAFAGRAVPVRASVRTPAGAWTARLLVDDQLQGSRTGTATSEETAELAFSFPAGRPGVRRLVLELAARGEGGETDREYGECAVRPLPRLAYVAPERAPGPLERLLSASGYPLERAALEDLAAGRLPPAADVILLEDVPASWLSWPAISALSRAAAWEGRGLLFVGGPRSFTAGDYRDAPVERLLPLTMGIRDPQEEKHRTALVIVLDTSWSMLCPPEGCPKDAERMAGLYREPRGPRVTKIDLARQALLELLPAMKQVDYFGILGVRTAPYWELEPGVFADPAAVEERVRRIAPSGSGILLYSALLEASKSVTALDAEIKHLLVLLDTDDIDEIRVLGVGTVEELVGELARQRVSVSFVGFGFSDDRYVPLLHQLASSTGGSLYLSSDVSSIPRFLRDDREGLAGRQALRRHLETGHDEAALPGLGGTPPLEGVFITEAKSDARTAVRTELGYPLLALRRLERGNVAAFASDGGRELAPAWATPAAREAWDAVLAALLRRAPGAGALFVSREGRGASVWWQGDAGGPAPTAAVAGPGGRREPAAFREIYPGSWRADIAALPPGSHQIAVTPAAGGPQILSLAVRPVPRPRTEARPDLGRFAPPPFRTLLDGRILPLLLVLMAASFIAYELVREHD